MDSSALLRLLYGEGEVTPVLTAVGEGATTSVLTEVEVRGSIRRRWHERRLDDAEAEGVLDAATGLLGELLQIDINVQVRSEAVSLTSLHPLRTLDALQLGAAAVARRTQRRHGASLSFLTADRRQADVARELFGDKRTILLDPL